MKKIVTFGEIMLRLTPPSRLRFNQTSLFGASYGGSEANVAVSLANYGLRSEFVTCVPDNRIADACLADLGRCGVETPHVVRRGPRLGLYYMEEAASLRSSYVVYDRAGASFEGLEPGVIDWEEIFRDAAWFHWSGISAAVSAGTAAVCGEAIAAARRMGLTVSCDINYRKNLWKYGKRIDEVLPPLMAECDVLFGTDDEFTAALGVSMPLFGAEEASYLPDTEGYEAAAREVARRMPACRTIVFALRNVLSANHHLISGTLWHEGRLCRTRVYDIDCVVDCVGVGDAFVGGIIYGLAEGVGAQRALDLGAAACALKNTVPGDYARATADELEALADGSVSGRIAR